MRVKTGILFGAVFVALAVGLVARGGVSTRATGSSPAVVKAAFNRDLKKTIVVDARGITLYAFYFDESGKPACYVDPGFRCVKSWPSCVDDPQYHCVKSWPPLTTVGRPLAGKGANAKLLGTARRRDGRLQVVYNHLPLYYYAGGLGAPRDTKPGDVNGQKLFGLWWVVSPRGLEIK